MKNLIYFIPIIGVFLLLTDDAIRFVDEIGRWIVVYMLWQFLTSTLIIIPFIL